MTIRTSSALFILLAGLTLVGCGKTEETADNAAPATTPAVTSTAPAASPNTTAPAMTPQTPTSDASNEGMQSVKPGEAGTR